MKFTDAMNKNSQLVDTPLPAIFFPLKSERDNTHYGCFSRKKRLGSAIVLVMTNWPFTTMGAGETGVQTVEGPRFVVDSNVKAEIFVGHEKTRLPP